jgi:hypothetical protein
MDMCPRVSVLCCLVSVVALCRNPTKMSLYVDRESPLG